MARIWPLKRKTLENEDLAFLPAALGAVLFWFLPETRGTEPEDLWNASSG